MVEIRSNFTKKVKAACEKKEALFDISPIKYIFRSILAVVFLTLTIIAGLVAADHLSAINPSLNKPVFAAIFSVGLVYVLFLGAELATGNMMFLTAAVYNKFIRAKKAIIILCVCTIGNLLGAYIITVIAKGSSALNGFDADSFVTSLVSTKLDKTSFEVFFAGILANIYVNIAVLSFMLIKNDLLKGFLIMAAVFMFVYIEAEHVVANFSLFSIAQLTNNIGENFTFLNVLRQRIFAFLGNFVGGGICIGLLYSWLNDTNSKFVE